MIECIFMTIIVVSFAVILGALAIGISYEVYKHIRDDRR